MMRRAAGILVVLSAVLVVILVAWDFVEPVHDVPQLAPAESRATAILVEKQARRLTLLHGDKVIQTFRISLGRNPIGAKQREGDSRTPEGTYEIDSKNRHSHFHLALHISYPDADDRGRAVSRNVAPGSDIMIHGLPNGLGWLGNLHLLRDWTDGCIAVTDPEIEEIWGLVDTGTPIQIKP
jgi:murein L,D-transpeptidase YafK